MLPALTPGVPPCGTLPSGQSLPGTQLRLPRAAAAARPPSMLRPPPVLASNGGHESLTALPGRPAASRPSGTSPVGGRSQAEAGSGALLGPSGLETMGCRRRRKVTGSTAGPSLANAWATQGPTSSRGVLQVRAEYPSNTRKPRREGPGITCRGNGSRDACQRAMYGFWNPPRWR